MHLIQRLVGCGLVILASVTPLAAQAQNPSQPPNNNWISVGNDRGCTRYSSIPQINRENVGSLDVAWVFHTGESDKTCECTPIIVDGVMYITTNKLRVCALDGRTGNQLWSFDPFSGGKSKWPLASGGVNRGAAYWSDGKPGGKRRILHGTSDGQLFSLNAETGELDPQFGNQGVKSLRKDIQRDLAQMPYGPTSPPAICGDVIIVGFSCGEGPGPAAPGDIRGFDVHTGKQLWRFHTVPRPEEYGNDSWAGDSWQGRGGANAWGGFSVDVERQMVFAGLGSAAFDFYGGDREGQNLFANCTIALDANTGKRVWHFQTLHHDLWDHDLPVYPNLVTLRRDGIEQDVAVQVTKTGFVFVFDRVTGKPVFEINEVPANQSDVPGEHSWPTQPVPVKPPPIANLKFNREDVTNISEESRTFVLDQLNQLRAGGGYNPPSLQGTIAMPGFHGGATWSGASFDPESGMLFVNTNNIPNIITLVPMGDDKPFPFGIKGYVKFQDQFGYPAIKPPWGLLTAIDLNRGELAWQVPLGEYAELTQRGIPATGTENFGGSIVTAGGLVFIGATKDEKFRAFDKQTGKVLWETKLPAGGYATPATYLADGKQYVVIAACGGGKPGTPSNDTFVSFALPE